jgi:hypothetical protein
VLMFRMAKTGALGPFADYISGCAEPFYGTMVGPWWYHTATSVPRLRNLPFSLLRMLMLPGCFGNGSNWRLELELALKLCLRLALRLLER